MNRIVIRVVSLLLAFLVCLPCFSAGTSGLLTTTVQAVSESNGEVRHTVCGALSDAAQAYYTGANRYETLAALSGAQNTASSFDAMQNNALFNALHALMAETHTFYTTYSGYQEGSLAYYWKSTDAVDGSDSYVMFYSDLLPSQEGVTLNREHIWPKSRASFYQTLGGADLHHLRPSAESVNMSKADHMFGYVNGAYAAGYQAGVIGDETLYWLAEDDDLFECKDNVKGDVARILLYVYCRWAQPNLYSDVAPAQLPALDPDDQSDNGVRVIESLDTLLQWCEDDPVDTWEMRRNDLIEEIQGNRNVFIDYPEFAWQLFGRQTPAGLTTPTKEGCAHQRSETLRIEPACVENGCIERTCALCGDRNVYPLAAHGHSDLDRDEFCDVCNAVVVYLTDLAPVTALQDGMHAVLYHPASGYSVGNLLNETNKLTLSGAHPIGGVLHPSPTTAVFTVSAADGGVYLRLNGKYLTSGKTGNKFYLQNNPNDCSVWIVGSPDANGLVTVTNKGAAFYGKTQALEYYNETFTCFSVADTDAFRLQLYATDDHVWKPGAIVTAPACETPGAQESICVSCGERKTEPLAPTGHSFVNYVYNNDATTQADGTETAKCEHCDATDTRIKAGTRLNPTANAQLFVADATALNYGTIVTITATATGVPEGCRLVLYLYGEKIEGSNSEVSYTYGALGRDLDYSVAVEDEAGAICVDGDGAPLVRHDGLITCKGGFFRRLIAFFLAVFRLTPKATVRPADTF